MIKTELTYKDGEIVKLSDRVLHKSGAQGRVTNITLRTSRIRVVWDRKEGKTRRAASLPPSSVDLIERNSPPDTSKSPELPPFEYEGGEQPRCNDRLIHINTGLFAIVGGVDSGKHLVHVRWPNENRNRRALSATEFRLIERGGMWAEGNQS